MTPTGDGSPSAGDALGFLTGSDAHAKTAAAAREIKNRFINNLRYDRS
jgi:hypothetical protein